MLFHVGVDAGKDDVDDDVDVEDGKEEEEEEKEVEALASSEATVSSSGIWSGSSMTKLPHLWSISLTFPLIAPSSEPSNMEAKMPS